MRKQRQQPIHEICEPSKVVETIARLAKLFKVQPPAFYVVHHGDGTHMPHVHMCRPSGGHEARIVSCRRLYAQANEAERPRGDS